MSLNDHTGVEETDGVEYFDTAIDAVKYAMQQAAPDEVMFICRGPDRCSEEQNQNGPCPFCYEVRGDDPRSAEDILRAASLGN